MDKFELGNVVITPIALDILFQDEILSLLSKHVNGDWGDLCEEDKKQNEYGLSNGLRLFSSYGINNKKIWIITEADRSATTILTPEEY